MWERLRYPFYGSSPWWMVGWLLQKNLWQTDRALVQVHVDRHLVILTVLGYLGHKTVTNPSDRLAGINVQYNGRFGLVCCWFYGHPRIANAHVVIVPATIRLHIITEICHLNF